MQSCEFKLPKYTNGKTQSVTHTLQGNIFPKGFLFVSSDHENTYSTCLLGNSNLPSWTILIYWVTNEQCSRNLQVLVKEGGPWQCYRSNVLKTRFLPAGRQVDFSSMCAKERVKFASGHCCKSWLADGRYKKLRREKKSQTSPNTLLRCPRNTGNFAGKTNHFQRKHFLLVLLLK